MNCQRQGEICDYNLRLNWGGRRRNSLVQTGNIPSGTLDSFVLQTDSSRIPVADQSILHTNKVPAQWASNMVDNGLHDKTGLTIPVSPSRSLSAPMQTPRVDPGPYSPGSSGHGTQNGSPSILPAELLSQEMILYSSPVDSAAFDLRFSRHLDNNRIRSQKIDPLKSSKHSPKLRCIGLMCIASRGGLSDTKRHSRVSVGSLLSTDAAESSHPKSSFDISVSQMKDSVNYGVDYGDPDFDLNGCNERRHPSLGDNDLESKSDEDLCPRQSFSRRGYYAKPVMINIPCSLLPLPHELLQTPINMLYFHHFLNHTARILSSHDCRRNPFVSVLPASMSFSRHYSLANDVVAIEDTNLLHMLLAYSASHRARLLGHPEPSNRIANWVKYVFPALRLALNDQLRKVSDTSLATAILLVSLKIISPSTFEVPITWQLHLKFVRELYNAYANAHVGRPPTLVSDFLSRWFGYIDVIGSLSCIEIGAPCPLGFYAQPRPHVAPLDVECFTGFTHRTASTLFRVAELVFAVHQSRGLHSKANVSIPWTLPVHLLAEAQVLLSDIHTTAAWTRTHRTYHVDTEADADIYQANPSPDTDSHPLPSSDDAFHLAAYIHLLRRVLDFPPTHPDVMAAVDALDHTLDRLAHGGSAELCVVFPLFTAGCEVRGERRRREIESRIRGFEEVGLKQVSTIKRHFILTADCGGVDSGGKTDDTAYVGVGRAVD